MGENEKKFGQGGKDVGTGPKASVVGTHKK